MTTEWKLPTLLEVQQAAAFVHLFLPPTPQYQWPILSREAGCELWIKHENHTPTGSFKMRGGLVYLDWLRRNHPEVTGVVTATRGNHGQSIAFAARRLKLRAVIVVPHGNSREKNAAMRAWGAELIEHGHDFHDADATRTNWLPPENCIAYSRFIPCWYEVSPLMLWSCSRLCPTWTLFTYQWAGVPAQPGWQRCGTRWA